MQHEVITPVAHDGCSSPGRVWPLSAQQFAPIDIILRHVQDSALSFGGVLIFGTFDHHQLGAIEGLPFLLSTHNITDFTLVKLEHSVRAAGDEILQVRNTSFRLQQLCQS